MALKIIVLLLLTVFYGVYFAKQIMLKKKGIATNRLAKGSKPKRTMRIETGLLICTYGAAIVQYLNVFLWQAVFPLGFPMAARVAGLALLSGGVLFFILATTTMRDNWRAGVDETQKTEMVTIGVYRVSRNPAFVGFDLLYIGTFLAFPSVLMLAAAVVSIVFMHLQILEEEKYLPTVFGAVYTEYKSKTPRYLFFRAS